jgi:hypothetical protein
MTLCERSRVGTQTVQSGLIDVNTATGRLLARMLGATARYESELKGERMHRQQQQAAEMGRFHGDLGYGYRRKDRRWVVVEPQAAVIREIARRVLAGQSLRSIARSLNERGITTREGNQWVPAHMGTMIGKAKYASLVEFEADRRAGPRPRFHPIVAAGDWPAILPRATTLRLRELLAQPHRSSKLVPHHLLTGILTCGRCGRPMSVNRIKQRPYYRCIKNSSNTAVRCGRISIALKHADAAVYALLVGALGDGMPADWLKLSLARRRRLVTSVFDHITVQPQARYQQPPAERLTPFPRLE